MKNKLNQLRLEVYKDCPKVCLHCYQGQASTKDDAPSPIFLEKKIYQKLIADFADSGGYSLSLTGGEFLLPSRWNFAKELLHYFVKAGITEIRINTILAYCNRKMIEELADIQIPNLIIQTGIDGKNVHDYLRFPGAMDQTLKTIQLLHEYNIHNIAVRATIFFGYPVGEREPDNRKDLPDILRLCSEYNVKRMKTKLVHYTGGIQGAGGLHDDREQYMKLFQRKLNTTIQESLEELIKIKETENIQTKLLFTKPLPDNFYKIARLAMEKDPENYKVDQCSCGSRHVSIDGDGNVFKCLYNFGKTDLSLGNLHAIDFSQISNNRNRLNYTWKEKEKGGYSGCSAFEDNLNVNG